MSGVKIRAATDNDIQAIAEIHVLSFQTAYRGIVPDEFLNAINVDNRVHGWRSTYDKYPRNLTVAVLPNDYVLGFCCAGPVVDTQKNAPYEFEIYGLHVRQECRRTGIGTQLLNDAFARALKSEQFTTAIVWTLTELVESRRFYERHGGAPFKNGTWKLGPASIPEISYGWQNLNAVSDLA